MFTNWAGWIKMIESANLHCASKLKEGCLQSFHTPAAEVLQPGDMC